MNRGARKYKCCTSACRSVAFRLKFSGKLEKMPPKQIRLDKLWGLSSAMVSDEQVEKAASIPAAPSKVSKTELLEELFAQEIGKEFVPVGSMDRFGNLRRNVGGRPRKLVKSDVKLKHKSSNRRQIGKRGKSEFSASEKLEMLKNKGDRECREG